MFRPSIDYMHAQYRYQAKLEYIYMIGKEYADSAAIW